MTSTTPTPAIQRCIDAAEAIAQRGDKVTLAAVRSEAGGGSMTTVSEAIAIWRAQQDQGQVSPPEANYPPPFAAAMRKAEAIIWAAVSAVMQEALDNQQQQHTAEREAMTADLDAMREYAATVDAESSQMRERMATIIDLLERAEARIDRLLEAATQESEALSAEGITEITYQGDDKALIDSAYQTAKERGLSQTEIAAALNDAGYRTATGKRWNKGTVNTVFAAVKQHE